MPWVSGSASGRRGLLLGVGLLDSAGPIAFLLRADSIRLSGLDRLALLVEVGPEVVDEFADRRSELLLVGLLELAGLGDSLEQVGVLGTHPGPQVAQELPHALHLDPVEEAAGARVDRGDLIGDLERVALFLFEQ